MEGTAPYNSLVVLGPTASGKTRLAVGLARELGGEVLSADSRQVYRGLDVGSGKDLAEYGVIPYHLIDIVDIETEFSVFDYQQAFYRMFEEVRGRGRLPIVSGGTGLYLDAVLDKYRMVAVPTNETLRADLARLDDAALEARLRAIKPKLHNTTDLETRERVIRAIEIAEYSRDHAPQPAPDIRALLLGTRWERTMLRLRIAARLRERLDNGLVEEVESLHASGASWARLEQLGLEYRLVADYLQGRIRNRNDLFQKLSVAIGQFAKRQESWFRRMERNGHTIHWVDGADLDTALRCVRNMP